MERFFSDPKALRRMRSGPLKEYIDLFAQQLCDLNYTRICGRILLRRIAQFSRWLKHRRIALQEITPEQVARYLEHHGEVKHGDVTNLNRLLAWLRQKGTIRETLAPIMNTPAKQLEDKFTLYLQQERGLASQTIEYYRRFTRRFLVQRFGDGRLALSEAPPRGCSELRSAAGGISAKAGEVDDNRAAVIPGVYAVSRRDHHRPVSRCSRRCQLVDVLDS